MTEQKYDERHGGPYDRGSADSWYSRPRNPHWYPEGTYRGNVIEKSDMTKEEIKAYHAGYDENEINGGHKEWE